MHRYARNNFPGFSWMPGTQKCLNYYLVNKSVCQRRGHWWGEPRWPSDRWDIQLDQQETHLSCFQLFQGFALTQPLQAGKESSTGCVFFAWQLKEAHFSQHSSWQCWSRVSTSYEHAGPLLTCLAFQKAHLEARGTATELKGKSQKIATTTVDVMAVRVSFRWIFRENRPSFF